MRHPAPARVPAAAFVAALLLVTALAAPPVGAKEFMQGRLDAPISFDSPAGELLVVGVTLERPGPDGEMEPVEGSPIYLELVGPTGLGTIAMGVADRRAPGHYTFHIEVPKGGARQAEIGIQGNANIPMMWQESPFTFDPIGPGTAQLAAAADAGQAAPQVPVPQGPATDPAAATPAPSAAPPAPSWAGLALALAAGALGVAALALFRRSRGAPTGRAADGAPGA